MIRSFLTVVLASASLALASPQALALQSGGGGRGGGPGGSGGAFPAATGMAIDFRGGTVREFIDHLQEQTQEQQVVIRNDLAANAVLPPIRLTNISMRTAMAALEALVQGDNIDGFAITNLGGAYIVDAWRGDPGSGGAEAPRGSDFVFEGGTGVEFTQAIKEVFPDANVVARGAARRATIPSLSLSNVYLNGVMAALDGMIIEASGSQPKLALEVEDRRMLFLIDAVDLTGPREEVQFRAMSLAHIIGSGGLSEQDALSAIEAAVEVGGGADPTRIQFHEETSLLIISAPPGVIGIVTQVVNTLDEAAAGARRESAERAQLEAEITVAESRMDYFSEVLANVEQQFERVTAAFEAGQVSDAEVYEQRLAVLEARASLKEAEARLMQLQRSFQAYE